MLWLALLALLLTGCAGQPDAVARVRASGILRIAMDPSFPPFEFVDGGGVLMGLDVDLARQIAARLGVEAHFVATSYDGLYDALTVNRADLIISALYPDLARSRDFAFSQPYFNAGAVLMVQQTATIDALEGLSGRRLGAVFGTEGHMEALRLEALLAPPPVILTWDTAEEAVAALVAGQVDGVIVDNIAAQQARLSGAPLRILDPPLTDERYVVAARRADAALIEAVDAILQEMQADGTLEALIAYWMR